jgi:GT2 family glycosyltransferase
MMEKPRVALAVLNWNGVHWLEKFLPTVVAHCPSYAEVVVIDNASSDSSVQYVKTHHPEVRIIQHPSNWGYAGGYNRALQQMDYTYTVLINSDIETTSGWLDPLVAYMDSHPNCGACQPKIKSYNQRDSFEYAGAGGGFLDVYGYPFCRGRLFDTLEIDSGQYDDECEVFWATGACLMVRNAAYFDAGGLDEQLFAHMEEIDLCWRMWRKGHTVGYCGKSEVYHVGGGTLASDNPRKTYYNFRNNLILLIKNLPREDFRMTLFTRLILDGVAGLKFLLDGKWEHTVAILRAHGTFYRKFSGLMRQRRKLRTDGFATQWGGLYKKSIALSYFMQGKKLFSDLDPGDFYSFNEHA